MRATFNGVTIARSDDTIVVEGNHYFPRESVEPGVLQKSSTKSLCPWKGLASYGHVEVGDRRGSNAAWSYHHPYPWVRRIKGRVAFWNGVEIRPD